MGPVEETYAGMSVDEEERVPWRDPELYDRLPVDEQVRCETFDTMYAVCIEGRCDFKLKEGPPIARGLLWVKAGNDPDAGFPIMLDTLARVQLEPGQRQDILQQLQDAYDHDQSVHARATIADLAGIQHGLPLGSYLIRGVQIMLVLDVLRTLDL